MTALTVDNAKQILASKTIDELFEISMSLEAQGNTELADQILNYACQKQAVESYEERRSAKPEPTPESTEHELDYLDSVIDELANVTTDDVNWQPMVAADYLHLSKIEMIELAKVFKVTIPPHPTRKELAQLLADAENGVQRPSPLEPKPEPKPVVKPHQPAFKHEPADQYVPKPVEPLTYREMQNLAKANGVKASGSYNAIEARIERHRSGTATDADYAKPKAKSTRKAKSEPKAKKSAEPATTLSYRQAQKFNSWCKANITGYCPPCKNSGWVNVRLLMVGWMNSNHFKQVCLVKKNVADLAAHLEVDVKDLFNLLQATATLA
jgi:hypothetical protein